MVGRWLQRILVANIVVQTGIIATGAVVRVTGSGLGCPSWPQCTQGSYTPTVHQEESWHKWVEYSNRTLTGILMIVAIAVVSGVWLHTRDKTSRILSLAPLLLTFGQAILGGITVLTGLNPYTVAAHFLLSTIIVSLSVNLWWRVLGHTEISPIKKNVSVARLMLFSAAVVIFLGVLTTGSGPHSGDIKAEARFSFDPSIIARIHGVSLTLLMFSLFAVWKLVQRGHAQLKKFYAVVTIIGLQAVVGVTQYVTGLPVPLVAVHVTLAATLWAAINILFVEIAHD